MAIAELKLSVPREEECIGATIQDPRTARAASPRELQHDRRRCHSQVQVVTPCHVHGVRFHIHGSRASREGEMRLEQITSTGIVMQRHNI